MNAGKIVLTKMEQIAINARRLPNVSFTSLAYHLRPSWLYDAYRTIRRDGALASRSRSTTRALADRRKSTARGDKPVSVECLTSRGRVS